MVTGDALLIAKEVAKRLGMHRNILTPARLNGDRAIVDKAIDHKFFQNDKMYQDAVDKFKSGDAEYKSKLETIVHCIGRCDGFAQVVPEDKYRVVELLQMDGHMVGMTGDGVNDAPGLANARVVRSVYQITRVGVFADVFTAATV
jgi:H+-transporting ATPase